MLKTLLVDLGDRSYPINIGKDILSNVEYFAPYIKGRQVMVVTNEKVAPLYLDKLQTALTDFTVDVTVLPDGEQHKNIKSVNEVFNNLLSQKHNRGTTLIALGGGVVGDMTGFAAACYQRGVDFIQVPTTLLSQVDSSVGGKTGVNHELGKNMIGAFHQPQAVVIDITALKTLPPRELSAGLAEVIKYGLIRNLSFLKWLEENIQGLLELDGELIIEAVARSCACKAEIVSADEEEKGVRAILNLGHTFGHAIEAYTKYKDWLLGEAVAVGIVMAAFMSQKLSWIGEGELKSVEGLIGRAKLPVRPPATMKPQDFLKFMSVDKKVIDGKLRLILLKQLGNAEVIDSFNVEVLNETLEHFTTH